MVDNGDQEPQGRKKDRGWAFADRGMAKALKGPGKHELVEHFK